MARADGQGRLAFKPDLARSMLERVIGDGLVLLVVLGWWLLSLRLPAFVMPNPWTVAVTTFELFVEPERLAHVGASAMRVVVAVTIAVGLGMVLALLPRQFPALRLVVFDRIQPLLSAFPSLGWALLGVIWFGISNFTVIFIEVAILTPFCLINITEGLKEMDTELIEMGRSFTRSSWRTFIKITLPLLVPYLVAALRMSYGVCWKLALVAELFGASRGLGYLMLQAQTTGDAATVFATCFAIVLLFITGERLLIEPLARMTRPAQT
jgi:NitT/TauT family transport system permease protein